VTAATWTGTASNATASPNPGARRDAARRARVGHRGRSTAAAITTAPAASRVATYPRPRSAGPSTPLIAARTPEQLRDEVVADRRRIPDGERQDPGHDVTVGRGHAVGGDVAAVGQVGWQRDRHDGRVVAHHRAEVDALGLGVEDPQGPGGHLDGFAEGEAHRVRGPRQGGTIRRHRFEQDRMRRRRAFQPRSSALVRTASSTASAPTAGPPAACGGAPRSATQGARPDRSSVLPPSGSRGRRVRPADERRAAVAGMPERRVGTVPSPRTLRQHGRGSRAAAGRGRRRHPAARPGVGPDRPRRRGRPRRSCSSTGSRRTRCCGPGWRRRSPPPATGSSRSTSGRTAAPTRRTGSTSRRSPPTSSPSHRARARPPDRGRPVVGRQRRARARPPPPGRGPRPSRRSTAGPSSSRPPSPTGRPAGRARAATVGRRGDARGRDRQLDRGTRTGPRRVGARSSATSPSVPTAA
jgi:hypothetical protein